MALACGMLPAHSTMAAFVSSRHEARVSLGRAMLRVCEEPGLLGGTPCAFEGLQLPAHAAKEWSGTWADGRPQQAKWEEKGKKFLEAPTRADPAGTPARTAAQPSAQATVHEQRQRGETQAGRMAPC